MQIELKVHESVGESTKVTISNWAQLTPETREMLNTLFKDGVSVKIVVPDDTSFLHTFKLVDDILIHTYR